MDIYDEDIALPVLSIAIAAVVSTATEPGDFSLWNSMVGLLLLILLGRFWSHGDSAPRAQVAYAAVYAFALIVTFGVFLQTLFTNWGFSHEKLGRGIFVDDLAYLVTWLGLSIVIGLTRWSVYYFRFGRTRQSEAPIRKDR